MDSFRDVSKESSKSMQMTSTNDSELNIRKQTQLALWCEKEVREALSRYFHVVE